MENDNNIEIIPATQSNEILSGSFKWMAIGLLVSAVTSFVVMGSDTILNIIFGTPFVFYGLLILELGAVIYFSARIMKISVEQAKCIFILYAILSGVTFSVIFISFQLSSILSIFVATAIMFGLLSQYGKNTSKDLTRIGRLAFFALIGIIIASIINIFLGNNSLDMVISWIGVIIFTVLIAYDVQKLKRLSQTQLTAGFEPNKIAIFGALSLYLDFINLFLNLLRIFGRRK